MPDERDSRRSWTPPLIAALIVSLILLVILGPTFLWPTEERDDVPLGTIIEDAKNDRILRIEVKGTEVTATYHALDPDTDQPLIRTSHVGPNTTIETLLIAEGVSIDGPQADRPGVILEYRPESAGLGGLGWLLNLLPFILIGAFLLFILRRSSGATSDALRFSRSQARLFQPTMATVTFADVAGVNEAKVELAEVVEFLQHPDRFRALGARIPRGVLLVGSPGTGKTLMARAVAGEAGVPFFSISGSEFVEMFVGVGASRVRDLFTEAKKHAPCIVFVDEIDAVGRQRGAGLGSGHDEREQTLNQILVEMDGFEPDLDVIVLAATNRPDILDPALIRPGRFDRKVVLDDPDVDGREAILNVHVRGKPLADSVDIRALARATPGFSGADLANLVNEGAILAARRRQPEISMDELSEAIDRVTLGPERRSRVMTDEEKRLTAYHEGGHAVVGHLMEHHDRPQKVSIVARGMAGGYTKFLPQQEARYRTVSALRDEICAALGGYAAERLVFGETSTGAAHDLKQVTDLARRMVTQWGMSTRMGPRTYGRREELVFLGKELNESRDYGDDSANLIDKEVCQLVDDELARAQETLSTNRTTLDRLVTVLLERETLEGDALLHALTGELEPDDLPPTPPPRDPEPPAQVTHRPGLDWPAPQD